MAGDSVRYFRLTSGKAVPPGLFHGPVRVLPCGMPKNIYVVSQGLQERVTSYEVLGACPSNARSA